MQTSPVDDADTASPRARAQGAPEIHVREASRLLREMLQLSAAFELEVGASLSVNRRDFEAMQHLISSGPLSPSDIARRLGVTTAAATVIVDRLTAVGHVTREPHPTDRRGVMVVPTPASVAAAMGHIMPLIMGVDGALDDFNSTEQSVITEYLRRVVELYREQMQ